MTMLAYVGRVLAELVDLERPTADAKLTEQAGTVTLVWVLGVLVILAVCVIAFRKSKRTHLD